jgi:RNA polymerase sigma-70 factor (ECF subfamily)
MGRHGCHAVATVSRGSIVRGHISFGPVSLEQPAANASNANRNTQFLIFAPEFSEFEVDRPMMNTGGIGPNDDRFETIYRKHYARVWRYYRACRVSDDEAHDLAQDAFKRLYERMDQIRGVNEWPFLESITKTILFNWIRAAKTAKRRAVVVAIDDPDFVYEPAAPPQPDYADLEEEALRRKRLRDAVGELSEGQRACLRLQMQGFEYKEIAKILGITMDAVKSRLRDAKKHLRERLGGKS